MPKLAEKKKYSHHLRSFIDFFDIHNSFKVPVNKLINIAAGVTVSNDINEDSAVAIGTKLAFGLDDEELGEISLKRKSQAKTFGTMRKSAEVGATMAQLSSTKLQIIDICCARCMYVCRYVFFFFFFRFGLQICSLINN